MSYDSDVNVEGLGFLLFWVCQKYIFYSFPLKYFEKVFTIKEQIKSLEVYPHPFKSMHKYINSVHVCGWTLS